MRKHREKGEKEKQQKSTTMQKEIARVMSERKKKKKASVEVEGMIGSFPQKEESLTVCSLVVSRVFSRRFRLYQDEASTYVL